MHPLHNVILASSIEDWVLASATSADYQGYRLSFLSVKQSIVFQVSHHDAPLESLAYAKLPTPKPPNTFAQGLAVLQSMLDVACTQRLRAAVVEALLEAGHGGAYEVELHLGRIDVFLDGQRLDLPKPLEETLRAGEYLLFSTDDRLVCEQGMFRGELAASSHARLQQMQDAKDCLAQTLPARACA